VEFGSIINLHQPASLLALLEQL